MNKLTNKIETRIQMAIEGYIIKYIEDYLDDTIDRIGTDKRTLDQFYSRMFCYNELDLGYFILNNEYITEINRPEILQYCKIYEKQNYRRCKYTTIDFACRYSSFVETLDYFAHIYILDNPDYIIELIDKLKTDTDTLTVLK